ncbi:hypothetical protein J8N05_19340 [Streptomyces sp. BH-SS-21]|uniref:Uncharacterized protein n=1 Tax=Streptomyces liliiviolaceus TaxID=2823109 RepID=A0A940Y493_9ACTN|nr:hypothetical protein [Streptomyces liliiviolaceus]MBQ0850344.1 hypothetical protein [Streptomyces liliiviolaceus]
MADEVVVHRWAGRLALAALRAEYAPPKVLPADAPGIPVRHHGPGIVFFVGKEALAELRVVTVRIEQRVRAVGLPRHGIGASRRGGAALGTRTVRLTLKNNTTFPCAFREDGQRYRRPG